MAECKRITSGDLHFADSASSQRRHIATGLLAMAVGMSLEVARL